MTLLNSAYRLTELNSMIDMLTVKAEGIADRIAGGYPKPAPSDKATPIPVGLAAGIDDEIQKAFKRLTDLNDQLNRLADVTGDNEGSACVAHSR